MASTAILLEKEAIREGIKLSSGLQKVRCIFDEGRRRRKRRRRKGGHCGNRHAPSVAVFKRDFQFSVVCVTLIPSAVLVSLPPCQSIQFCAEASTVCTYVP